MFSKGAPQGGGNQPILEGDGVNDAQQSIMHTSDADAPTRARLILKMDVQSEKTISGVL